MTHLPIQIMTEEEAAAHGSAARASRAIGAMFFAVFGGAWVALWCFVRFDAKPGYLLLVAAATAALLLAAIRQFKKNRAAHAAEADLPESKRAGRIFNTVNAIQWVVVFIVSTSLSKLGHYEWIIPSIILIIGIHFLPLAVAFKVPRHYLTGAALILLAILYPLMAKTGPRSPTGCLGAGIILWASAGAALVRPA
jgi:hypothetical protein